MNKPIRTYHDLLEEQKQMELLLKAQRELLRQDFILLKEDMKPVMKTAGVIQKVFSRDRSNPLLNTGANTVIDLVLKKLVLGRAGWVVKLIVPFLVKNVSSHVIADKKGTVLHKIARWLRPKHHNGQTAPGPDPAPGREDIDSNP